VSSCGEVAGFRTVARATLVLTLPLPRLYSDEIDCTTLRYTDPDNDVQETP